MFKKLLVLLSPVLLSLIPLSVVAMKLQGGFYESDVYSTSSGADALGGVAFLFIMAIWCGVIILSLIVFVVWILSIVDIVKRDNWKSENDRIIWLLLIIFINIVSLYYYFVYRKNLDKAATSPKVESSTTT